MPTYISPGPVRVTITPLGPAGPVGGLVILGLAVGLVHRYAHTITQAAWIVAGVAFGAVVLAVVTMAVLTVRRIMAEMRPARRRAAVAAPDTTAGQLRSGAAPAIAAAPPDSIDVKPEWIIPRETAR